MFSSIFDSLNRLFKPKNPRMELVSLRPWENGPIPVEMPDLPSMLNFKEKKLLYWLTAEFYRGTGAIVELGTFLGSSTAHLAEGLLANSQVESKMIHSYDLFAAGPFEAKWLTERFGLSAAPGYNFRHLFSENVEKYADILTVTEGDICDSAWTGGEIEILFVDLCKTHAINDFVIMEYFPHLVPGSLLIQEDYIHGALGWLHTTMELLSSYAVPVADTDTNSMVYYIKKPIPQSALKRCLWDATTFDEKMKLMDRAIERLDTQKKREMVTAAKNQLVNICRREKLAA
ncbi:MAG: class I SAM-dependent methyltransferase [Planctomycetales bacterium]|nr:class I SAM-dependent methyltransferase [Planctomycetales bacterium]